MSAPGYDAALAASFDAGFVVDRDGRVLQGNAAAQQLFGYEHTSMIGRALTDLVVPDDDRDGLRGPRTRFPVAAVHADGSQLASELSVAPLAADDTAADDAPAFLVWVREVAPALRWGVELIERESELRNMGERLRTLVANLPLGVIVEDQDRNLLLANDQLLQIFAMERDEALEIAGRPVNIGAAFAELFSDPDAFVARREAVIAKREQVLNERIETAAGHVFERSFFPILVDDRFEGQVWLWRDVNAQVEAERAHERAFEAEVALNAALQAQVESLADLNRLKSEFVATVSHELRTPLTTVVGFAELLLAEPGLTDEQREFVEVIDRSGDRLLRLVGDLMLLARAEAGGLQLELGDLDVARLCREAAEESVPADQRRGITMTTDIGDGPPARGDAVRLRQVIDNLLSNARKFTPNGGRVSLGAQAEGDGWLIEVADTGIGIAPDEQAHIFERFYRASNAGLDQAPGIGLGLAVTRAIVELHGGTITLRSTPGEGTTVSVVLPRSTSADDS